LINRYLAINIRSYHINHIDANQGIPGTAKASAHVEAVGGCVFDNERGLYFTKKILKSQDGSCIRIPNSSITG
jgi:hypothetical protein